MHSVAGMGWRAKDGKYAKGRLIYRLGKEQAVFPVVETDPAATLSHLAVQFPLRDG